MQEQSNSIRRGLAISRVGQRLQSDQYGRLTGQRPATLYGPQSSPEPVRQSSESLRNFQTMGGYIREIRLGSGLFFRF